MKLPIEDKLLIVNTYLAVLFAYALHIMAFYFFYDLFPGSIIIWILMMLWMIIYHFGMFENLDTEFDKVEDVFWYKSILDKCWVSKMQNNEESDPELNTEVCNLTTILTYGLLCPLVLLRFNEKVEKFSLKLGKWINDYEYLTMFVKLVTWGVIWIFYKYWSGTDENVILTLYLLSHFIIATYSFKKFQSLYYIIVMTIPLLLIYSWRWLGKNWNKKLERSIRRNDEEQSASNINIEQSDSFNLNRSRRNRNNRIQNLPSLNRTNRQTHYINNSRSKFKRLETFDVLDKILKDWKRSETLNKTTSIKWCWVWLEQWKPGQDLIELKWGKNHIFHKVWIKRWAQRRKTWPIWRTDFIDLARNEVPYPYNDNSLEWSQLELISFYPLIYDQNLNNRNNNSH